MVDDVMEVILMLLFLKSLRNGERELIDDDAEDFDFLGSLITDRETTQQHNVFWLQIRRWPHFYYYRLSLSSLSVKTRVAEQF